MLRVRAVMQQKNFFVSIQAIALLHEGPAQRSADAHAAMHVSPAFPGRSPQGGRRRYPLCLGKASRGLRHEHHFDICRLLHTRYLGDAWLAARQRCRRARPDHRRASLLSIDPSLFSPERAFSFSSRSSARWRVRAASSALCTCRSTPWNTSI